MNLRSPKNLGAPRQPKIDSSASLRDTNNGFLPWSVHRLDVDTFSVMCITLTWYMLHAASMIFEQKIRSLLTSKSGRCGDRDDGDGGKRGGVVIQKQFALVEGTLGGSSDEATAT